MKKKNLVSFICRGEGESIFCYRSKTYLNQRFLTLTEQKDLVGFDLVMMILIFIYLFIVIIFELNLCKRKKKLNIFIIITNLLSCEENNFP